MNYMTIVLQFRNNPSIIDYLDRYFIREWKKAEANYYSAEEFFQGCQSAINQLESGCNSNFILRQNRLVF